MQIVKHCSHVVIFTSTAPLLSLSGELEVRYSPVAFSVWRDGKCIHSVHPSQLLSYTCSGALR